MHHTSLSLLAPAWWHANGAQIAVLETGPDYLHLGFGTAHLLIARQLGRYSMTWELSHVSGDQTSYSQGIRWFTADMIRQAFGLVGAGGGYLIRPGDFLADAYVAGHFIRSREYLNIPSPGNGQLFDPNLSVLLTSNIQDALRDFLATAS